MTSFMKIIWRSHHWWWFYLLIISRSYGIDPHWKFQYYWLPKCFCHLVFPKVVPRVSFVVMDLDHRRTIPQWSGYTDCQHRFHILINHFVVEMDMFRDSAIDYKNSKLGWPPFHQLNPKTYCHQNQPKQLWWYLYQSLSNQASRPALVVPVSCKMTFAPSRLALVPVPFSITRPSCP